MRTSMIGAALLLAGAGAAGFAAAAADVNGNSLALNGSDTLFDVTNEVLGTCTTTFGATSPVSTLSYLGGGSGVGAGQMGLGQQAISPMSRAMANTEFCAPLAATVYGGTQTSASGKAEGLLLGIDGVAIAANQVMSCADSSTNPTPVVGANGFAPTSMSVLAGGTGAAVSSCNGCESGTNSYVFGSSTLTSNIYKTQPSFDALAVLYFGLTHDGIYSGCGSDVRKSLIAHWANLFSTDCAAGDGVCTAGLTHAWRRSDLSGTTDAFVSVLAPPGGTDTNLKGFARNADGSIQLNTDGTNKKLSIGIGTLSNVPVGSSKKSNPFCNSADAQTFVNLVATPNTSAATTFGGSSDFSDQDPVRTKCGAAGTEDVCQFSSNFAAAGSSNAGGDLGVVLPILLPDGVVVNKLTDDYPATQCSTLCTLVAVSAGSKIPTGFKCPGGGSPIAGACYMPYFTNGTDLDPRCTTKIATKCVGAKGTPDFRTYNLPVIVNASVFSGTLGQFHGNKEYQFGVDANLRILNNSFYRIHEYSAGSHYAAGVGSEVGTTGLCNENDDTSQIGCLTDADPCSLGYAGREAARAYPGAGLQKTKALAVNGTPPFTPTSVSADADLALENLLVAGTPTPLYPLARRLYFNTIFGFSNLQGGEAQLASCMGTSTISGGAIQDHGFVKPPLGVQCLDYPEGNGTSAPAPNVNGTGNAALGGCGSGTANTDACTTYPLLDVNGTTVPEATETF
jgi:ABC-type phosphate transport system substrate-binding protein